MRKYINTSFIYFIFAMIAGVFYREYTKAVGFSGRSSLAFVHGHLLALGMIMFLIIALFGMKFDLQNNKKIRYFYIIYNLGLILTAVMLFVRGIVQVNNYTISKGLDASISGVAGIGHMLIFIALIFMFLGLREESEKLS